MPGLREGAGVILQPYLRVSTDDKGQDPIRQMNRIEPWASTEKATLLPAIVDEGTSATKTRPFDRPKFREALDAAKAANADGIVVETEDRFTRKGSRAYFAAQARLEDDYGLKLYTTGLSIATQESAEGEMLAGLKAYLGRKDADERRAKTISGIQRAKEKGVVFGRPRKPFDPAELEFVRKLRNEGKGWEYCAHQVNEARGVWKIAQPDLRKERSISPTALRNALAGRTNEEVAKRVQDTGGESR